MTVRPPFAYVGGKQRLARRIADLFGPHDHYVEPYAGGLAVLAAKQPSAMETVNDVDGALTTFWRTLRDHPEELAWRCAMTPHSAVEFAAAREALASSDPVTVAHAVWVMVSQGRGGRITRTGWRRVVTAAAKKAIPAYLDAYLDRLLPVAERLRHVSIECRDALEVIAAYDSPGTAFYVDPPYMPGTRRAALYRHEPNEAHHRALLATLRDCTGHVVLSGYPSSLYDEALTGWHRVGLAATAATGGKRTEVLWSNYPLSDAPHMGPLHPDLVSVAEA